MTLIYFAISALDVMGTLDSKLDQRKKQSFIEYIYNLQIHPKMDDCSRCGFRGSPYIGAPFDANQERKDADESQINPYDEANLAMTYTALCTLKILGDDFSRVNKRAIISSLKFLQQLNGSFTPTSTGGESDMRFIFCACAISTLLGDWSGFDRERTVKYIVDSQSYDGGIGLYPDAEGHGGPTYCAIASLALLNRLQDLSDLPGLIKWCLKCQGSGYRGRLNKEEDTCYSFWIGATLSIVGASALTVDAENRAFTMKCQSQRGGFSKVVNARPDLLHAYFGLCGLSIMGVEDLLPLDVSLGITKRALGATKNN